MRPITLLGVAAISVLVVACGPPVIYDTANRPVRNPLITASVDNGWLAVDSTEAGIRVVVELQLEGPASAADFVSLHLLRAPSRREPAFLHFRSDGSADSLGEGVGLLSPRSATECTRVTRVRTATTSSS